VNQARAVRKSGETPAVGATATQSDLGVRVPRRDAANHFVVKELGVRPLDAIHDAGSLSKVGVLLKRDFGVKCNRRFLDSLPLRWRSGRLLGMTVIMEYVRLGPD